MWWFTLFGWWLGMSLLTTAAVLAQSQHVSIDESWNARYPEYADESYRKDLIRADERYRDDLAFAVFMGIWPWTWVIAFFMTGFYQYGFQLLRRPIPAPKTVVPKDEVLAATVHKAFGEQHDDLHALIEQSLGDTLESIRKTK